jgi:hypothetical protein
MARATWANYDPLCRYVLSTRSSDVPYRTGFHQHASWQTSSPRPWLSSSTIWYQDCLQRQFDQVTETSMSASVLFLQEQSIPRCAQSFPPCHLLHGQPSSPYSTLESPLNACLHDISELPLLGTSSSLKVDTLTVRPVSKHKTFITNWNP